jgi:hypothetical protein
MKEKGKEKKKKRITLVTEKNAPFSLAMFVLLFLFRFLDDHNAVLL